MPCCFRILSEPLPMALTAVTSGLALAGQERHCSASLERAMSLKCEIFPARTRSTS